MTGPVSDWIGRTVAACDTITPHLVARFDATFGRTTEPEIGMPAPLGIHWCLAPIAVAAEECGPDGHPMRGLHLPPIALPRRMWAGGRLTLSAPLLVGDSVERVTRIEAIESKQGRSGELCLVRVAHEWRSGGAVAIQEQQDIVFRAAGGETPRSEPRLVPEGVARREFLINEVALFRYSALTFNAHRIHYDWPYATGVEGYGGLVVHGPLQATMLLSLAAELGGVPKQFSFRGTRPLIAGSTAALNAIRVEHGMDLWVNNDAGAETMSARADW